MTSTITEKSTNRIDAKDVSHVDKADFDTSARWRVCEPFTNVTMRYPYVSFDDAFSMLKLWNETHAFCTGWMEMETTQ